MRKPRGNELGLWVGEILVENIVIGNGARLHGCVSKRFQANS
jgi:hypothetical protein